MKKAAGIIGLVFAGVFLFFALNVKIPEKYIRSYGSNSMTEYVGGDAYNYIIEASLRSGEISGKYIQRSIYFSVSALLFVISLSLFSDPTKLLLTEIKSLSEKLNQTNNIEGEQS